jgi:formate-dependent phosphoribosylglycinamide formyltransferase (GAR transformylase)
VNDLKNVKTAVLEARLAKVTKQRDGLKYLAANITTLNLTADYVLAHLRRDLRDEAAAIEAELALRAQMGLPVSAPQVVSHVLA